ncbi:MAG: dockerin type I domain-containing protein [Defluviitaleaceae bacterium]|nr:dockerin type I domain-containing protein [Defluviitaleaceae bacterium]
MKSLRKFSIFVVAALVLLSGATPISAQRYESEGRVFAMADVFRLEQYLAGQDVDIDRVAMDVNGDGRLTREDAELLRAYLAGHPVILPQTAPHHAPGSMVVPMSINEIEMEIRVSNSNPGQGQDVDVEIHIIDNPGVAFFDLHLEFDASRFEQRNPTATVEYSDMFPPGEWNPVPVGGIFRPDFTNSEYEGLLATVHFRVRDDAASGEAIFNLHGSMGDIAFNSIAPVGVLTQTVTIFGPVVPSGVAEITWIMAVMFASLAASAVLWAVVLRRAKRALGTGGAR